MFSQGLLRISFNVAESDRQSVIGRQFGEHPRQALAQGVDRGCFIEQYLGNVVGQRYMLVGMPETVGQDIAGDLEEPCPGVFDDAELRILAQRPDEDFLQQVVSFFDQTGTVAQKTVQFSLMGRPGGE